MEIQAIRTPGLGDATYILAHAGLAVVVDPQRDVDRFLSAAKGLGAQIGYVLETHLHNDYVSGGRDLASTAGAQLVLPAGAGVAFDHLPGFHQEDLATDVGFTIRPLHTPGHTPEHLSYLILFDDKPYALFSGGSLLVSSAGRTDMLGHDRAGQLAKLQYGSLQRLTRLPDEVGLFPTHGEGSFCTASGAGRTTSTIGLEKEQNPVLHYPDVEAFVTGQLAGLQPFPSYYPHMAPINTSGPKPIPSGGPADLTPADLANRGQQVYLVDARPRAAFAAGHVAGSLGVELSDQFGTWVGWLLPFNAEIAIVLDPDQDIEEAVVQLARIGFDRVHGVFRHTDAWRAEGRPLVSYPTVGVPEYVHAVHAPGNRQLLDVRAPAEWEAGHLPGSLHCYLPDLAAGVPTSLRPNAPVWVACGTGRRASIAAGLLEHHGFQPVVLSQGGVPDVLKQLHLTPAAA